MAVAEASIVVVMTVVLKIVVVVVAVVAVVAVVVAAAVAVTVESARRVAASATVLKAKDARCHYFRAKQLVYDDGRDRGENATSSPSRPQTRTRHRKTFLFLGKTS
jgi:Tfp pilus assembly protein PilE